MPMTDSISARVVVAGGGLVGSLASLLLARRGIPVDLYERRPDMRRETISAGRSINLAVSVRGLHALGLVGLAEAVLAEAVPMRGRMMHGLDGTLAFQPYGLDESECIHSISRGALNKALLTAAEGTGRVAVRFRHRAVSADLDGGRVSFVDEATGERHEAAGDLVLGTDGSGSVLRKAASERPGFTQTEEPLDYGYKEFHIPPAPGGGHQLEKHALHIWPRGSFMLIALPNFDGSFTCTLFLPWVGPVSFEALKAADTVVEFFARHFPDVVPLLGDVAGTFFTNPTGQMVTVKCGPWNVGRRTLLLGDAAHAIVPFFGQGMNCGFEDCALLDALIASAPDDWTSRLAMFAASRKPDADAIADMAVGNFVEMRDKVGDARFLLEKQVEKLLLKEFPDRFVSRYALVSFSRMPYRLAAEAGRAGDELLAALCEGLPHADRFDRALADRLLHERFEPVITAARAALTA